MPQRITCPACGTRLAPGEKCDCRFDISASEIQAIWGRHNDPHSHSGMIIDAYKLGRSRGKEEAARDAATSTDGTHSRTGTQTHHDSITAGPVRQIQEVPHE